MIWFILILATTLRLLSLDQSLWLDEAINVLATQNFSLIGMITEYAKADFHPPLFFITLWAWTKLFGISEVVVRIPSIIFGVLTVYMVYLIGDKLHSKRLAILVALLLTVNPLHIYYSQEVRMYALATLVVSLNIFLLIKLLKREKFNLIFLVISNLAVLGSDYVAYFIFPAQLIALLLLRQKEFLKKWLLSLISAVAMGIFWIPTFLNQLNVGTVTAERLPAWKFIVGSFDPKAIPLTFIKFIIGKISYPDKLIYTLILLPVVVLFLFILWRGIKFIKDKEQNIILGWMLIPPILATIISFIIPIYSYFRLLFILPAFLILISWGILSFKGKVRYVFLAVCLVIQIFSAMVYLFNPKYQRDDWKGVVNFLKSQGRTPVLFESSGSLPPFEYYARGKINASGALKDFPAKDTGDVANLENLLEGAKDAYLVEYLVDISDPKRLVQKRLAELNYDQTEVKNFNGVGFVYHYRLKK